MEDLIICPNGHPNRPGRSLCVVCRAPLPVEAATETEQPPAPATTPPPATDKSKAAATPPVDAQEAAKSSNGGCGRWAALGIIGLIAVGVVLVSIFWPQLRTSTEQTLLVEPTATPLMAVVVVPTEPTQPVAPTDIPQPPTVEPAVPEPTDVPPPDPTTAPEPTAPVPTEIPPTDDGEQPLDHGNLIVNGDFSERWVDSWTRQVSENNGVQAAEVVAFDAAPVASGLRLTKTGTGTTRLEQTIDVPRRATEMRFTGDVRLVGSLADDGVSEGRVALMLVYLDENGQRLGHSVWMDSSQTSSSLWNSSPLPDFGPQLSPRFVEGDGWQSIDVRLQDEFVNRLPGLNADVVKQIGINLLAVASDTCGPTECPVTMEVGNLQFLPTDAVERHNLSDESV